MLGGPDAEAEIEVTSGGYIQINIKSINAGDIVELTYDAGLVQDIDSADTRGRRESLRDGGELSVRLGCP